MPLYDLRCESGHEFDRFISLSDFDKPQFCDCGKEAKRVIKPTMINPDIAPWDYYESPVSGKPIRSYKERKEDMARHDCVDYDPGMKKVQEDTIRRNDLALEKKMEATVEKEIDKMPSHKREKLYNEMVHGDLDIVRKSPN